MNYASYLRKIWLSLIKFTPAELARLFTANRRLSHNWIR